jgi:hypothetical protein
MLKSEFEQMAMRNNQTIGQLMYQSVEQFYMSINQYHRNIGGIDESKQAFINRVFGGKINTQKTIAKKLTTESIKENRYLLNGHDKDRLDDMDIRIADHYKCLLEYGM